MADHIQFQIALTKKMLDEERDALKSHQDCELGAEKPVPLEDGKGISNARFVDPVSLVGVVTLAWLTKRMVDHWLKSDEQGVQIDLREKPPAISRIAGVPMGFIVIINVDGKPETHKADYEKSEDLMPVIEKALAST